MKALRSVLAGLSTKRFVIEAPALGGGSPGQGPAGLTGVYKCGERVWGDAGTSGFRGGHQGVGLKASPGLNALDRCVQV